METNGSTMEQTRAFIINGAGNTKLARSIPGASRGEIDSIISYNPKKEKYKVAFKMPDGSLYYDVIPKSYLRSGNPTQMSAIEKEFFKKK